MEYGEILQQLTPDAEALLCLMVVKHLRSDPGRGEFHTSADNGRMTMTFAVEDTRFDVDAASLSELSGYGLLRSEHQRREGETVYGLSAEALPFHRWLQDRRVSAIASVEASARRLINSEEFAVKHASVVRELNEAAKLLWSNRIDDQTVSALGGHLRQALRDVVTDLVGDDGGDPAHPVDRLRKWDNDLDELEADSLAQLLRMGLLLSRRFVQIDSRSGDGHPIKGHEELRRAFHLVTVTCCELSGADTT